MMLSVSGARRMLEVLVALTADDEAAAQKLLADIRRIHGQLVRQRRRRGLTPDDEEELAGELFGVGAQECFAYFAADVAYMLDREGVPPDYLRPAA